MGIFANQQRIYFFAGYLRLAMDIYIYIYMEPLIIDRTKN